MTRMTQIVLEDRDGQWRHAVDWFTIMRPFRFEHEGRTFDASRQLDDGTWGPIGNETKVGETMIGVDLKRTAR